MPALNVTRDEIDRMIEGARTAIQAVRGQVLQSDIPVQSVSSRGAR
jgi:hypothetical protein